MTRRSALWAGCLSLTLGPPLILVLMVTWIYLDHARNPYVDTPMVFARDAATRVQRSMARRDAVEALEGADGLFARALCGYHVDPVRRMATASDLFAFGDGNLERARFVLVRSAGEPGFEIVVSSGVLDPDLEKNWLEFCGEDLK